MIRNRRRLSPPRVVHCRREIYTNISFILTNLLIDAVLGLSSTAGHMIRLATFTSRRKNVADRGTSICVSSTVHC